ncbi:CPBP family intramembrane metalloprotease [Streptococcus oralis]|jgi:caax amino protease family|uniref:CPBP family intramembrane glutamic endopeptidase n=1 Tax=Streptococcus oralis TaxID=1303 RepID=UPI0022842AD3|nr:CPBP family intramembrane glutamic endopeptidase [Streptococcus oralis]MCY7096988.1 CPBP family intramembrane metalloprotease [Streptococcus oralis]
MKKRSIQILLALSLIFYKSTWFWRLFNHLAKPYLPASREFFQILLLMESGVLFLAVLHLKVFEGRKIMQFKWQPRYFIYLLLGYIISYMSDFLLSYFIPSSSNQISLNETIEMIGRQELPYFLLIVCFIGPIAEELIYRGVLMTTFFKNSPWYGDILLSAIIFGCIHINFALTPLAFFIYASGGLILALLYRMTKNLYYPIVLHILINITAFWDLWLLLFSGS